MDTEGLSAICHGLGTLKIDDDNNPLGYEKDEHCLENLKDLMRFLKRDDPKNREVFKQVCKWKIVSKNLIPIIEYFHHDHDLVLNAVKVLVLLTMPIDPESNDISLQIEFLWNLKSSFTRSGTVEAVVWLLDSPLENLELKTFSEDDWKLVQLVLTLFRNILAIQEISLQQKAGGSAHECFSLRDRFLELLFHENVMDIFIVLVQHVGGSGGYLRNDNLLLLEIFHNIFMGQEPELIAKAYLEASKVDADAKASLNSLKSFMEEEEEKRKLMRVRNLGRYSHFSGTFTRLSMDGSKTVVKGNPSSASHNTLRKPHKGRRGRVKRIAWDQGRLPPTRDKILQLLHDFVNQFLSGGYNVLIQSIRKDIEKEHHAIQNCDVIVFFQVAQFVSSFQYHKILISKPNMETEAFVNNHADNTLFKGNICGPIAASMNESMFLLVISKWRCAVDSLKETNNYKFLSAAGSVTKIMIRMLDLVLKLSPEDSKEPQIARILLYKLFYDQTDQGMTQFLLNLIKSFDTHKQPKSDLADLVEIIHVIVRLMDNLQAHGTLRVSKKSRKGRKKKTLSDKDTADKPNGESVIVQDEIGISNNEQSVDLSTSPKGNSINAGCDSKEEDANFALQVDGNEPSVPEMKNLGEEQPQTDSKKDDHTNDDLDYDNDDSSNDEQLAATNEVDFQVSNLVSAFANDNIIHNLCWLLSFYKSNSISTNHYIICMLRRICDDLELSAMLYQLSLLTTFYNILEEQKSCPCKEYENIVYFLTSLVRRMLRKMKSQPLLFVEILFWKTRRECHYINSEALLHELGNMKKETRNWGAVSGDGDSGPLQGQGGTRRSIADALGDDEADFVNFHEGDNQMEEEPYEAQAPKVFPRNKGRVRQVKESITSNSNGEINGDGGHSIKHDTDGGSKRKKRLVLKGELEEKIKGLYEKYKDDSHCSHLIAEALDPEGKISSVQVSYKLKRLGLKVSSKKGDGTSGDPDQLRKGESSNDLEGRSLPTRKRARVLSEDQEMQIKALFEQFKDQRRCSYMIANALDGEGKVTAAQVSRKLKKLGLQVHRQKRSESTLRLRDEDLNDSSTDGGQDSDDETLISLKNRKKNKGDSKLPGEEASKQKSETKLSDDLSDDELLCSVVKKSRKKVAKTNKSDKQSTTSSMIENESGDLVIQDVIERNGGEEAKDMEVEEVNAGLDGSSVAEATGISSVPVYEELEDSGDDVVVPVEDASPKKASTRRKLRMVVDLEEDDL